MLRVKHPEMERPYKIPGGLGMGLFAAIVMTIVFVGAFIKVSPFFVGMLSIKMFVIWVVIGIVFYLLSGGQRRGLSEAELEAGVFGEHKG